MINKIKLIVRKVRKMITENMMYTFNFLALWRNNPLKSNLQKISKTKAKDKTKMAEKHEDLSVH